MLKKLIRFGLAAGAATSLLAATPAHAVILYQFWQGGTLVGQIAMCESGGLLDFWGDRSGTPVPVFIEPYC